MFPPWTALRHVGPVNNGMLPSYPYASVPPVAPTMIARETPALPQGEDWIYEFLWGGERVRAQKSGERAQLLSREGKDITNRFPRIVASVAKLRTECAVLDGEIVYLENYPPAAVRILMQSADELMPGTAALLAYDLLCDEGNDIRRFSLLCRRLLLASTLQSTAIALSPLVDLPAEAALVAAAKYGLRGVVAKRAGSLYRPNALSSDWVKLTFPSAAAGSSPPFDSPNRTKGGAANRSPLSPLRLSQ